MWLLTIYSGRMACSSIDSQKLSHCIIIIVVIISDSKKSVSAHLHQSSLFHTFPLSGVQGYSQEWGAIRCCRNRCPVFLRNQPMAADLLPHRFKTITIRYLPQRTGCHPAWSATKCDCPRRILLLSVYPGHSQAKWAFAAFAPIVLIPIRHWNLPPMNRHDHPLKEEISLIPHAVASCCSS